VLSILERAAGGILQFDGLPILGVTLGGDPGEENCRKFLITLD
jgi:hypothetical protein